MGFFAVVEPLGGEGFNEPSVGQLAVEKFDVNVWLLPLLLGRHVLYCDVGLRLRATTPVRCVDIGVPFATDQQSLTDLYTKMRDPEVAALVFGEPINPDTPREPGTSDYDVCRPINTSASRYLGELSDAKFSLWRVQLQRALDPGETAYIRFRFEARSFGRTVVWRRAVLRRVGVLVDLHFYDPREAALVPQRSRYDAAMIPTARLNAFFIVIASLRMRKTSPELRYLRLLEGAKWEKYLDRATDLRRRGKFLVHYWRAPGEVGVANEYRAFLDLGRRTESLGWTTATSIVVGTAGLVVLSHEADAFAASPLAQVLTTSWSASWTLLSQEVGLLVGLGIVVLGITLIQMLESLRPVRGFVVRRFKALERALYRKAADL